MMSNPGIKIRRISSIDGRSINQAIDDNPELIEILYRNTAAISSSSPNKTTRIFFFMELSFQMLDFCFINKVA